MDLLYIESNINKTHQGRISTLEGSSVFFSGPHLSKRGALHAFLKGATTCARGSGFSARFSKLVCQTFQTGKIADCRIYASYTTLECYWSLSNSHKAYLSTGLLKKTGIASVEAHCCCRVRESSPESFCYCCESAMGQ